jgi:cupin fold WbuC family metalloprotein
MSTTDRPVVQLERGVSGILVVGPEALADVVSTALTNTTGRARINAHASMDAPVHEMVIAFRGGSYVRPHKHRAKRESFHVISGRLDALTYDDEGHIKERISLGSVDSGLPFYLRSEQNDWHSFVVVSEVAVVHETTSGPFEPGESIFPRWAPDPADETAVQIFLNGLNT